MSIWSKVVTALRGGVNEAGEVIADTQSLRILDQEIREAEEEIDNSKNNLAEMMARQKVAEKKCSEINTKIIDFENYAIQALDKNDESLALDLAEKIADMEKQRKTEQMACDDYTSDVNSLRQTIKQADINIKHLKHQVDSVRATENVQRAQAAVAQRHSDSNSKLTAAMESLERIKEKQQLKSARFDAAQELEEELAEESINERLESAGILEEDSTTDTVLARLKHKVTLRLESDSHIDN